MSLNKLKNNILFLFVIIITACSTPQNIAYFQDEPVGNFTPADLNYQLVYQPDDMLTIDVSALDPEAVRPFVLSRVSSAEIQGGYQTYQRQQSYIIDNEGNIDFPVLGKVKLENLTRNQATELLKTKISEYVKNPIVNIRLINFTITVLGEVNQPGTFTITDEKVTLTEALGLAGDLTINGKRENILLVRDIDGQKKYSKINLTSVKTLYSESYILKQDDLIIVEPNKAKIRASNVNPNTALFISAVAALATVVAIIIQ